MIRPIFIIFILTLNSCSMSSNEPKTESKYDHISMALDKSNRKIADSSNRYSSRLLRVTEKVKEITESKVYIDPKIDLFLIGGNLRVNSGLMDMMRDDELLSLIINEQAHNSLGHYDNRFANVNNGYENALDQSFSDSQNSAADAYTINYFNENKLDPQSFVNAAYKLARVQEKSSADIVFSSRLINEGSRDRARALANMLQEAKANPTYLQGLIQKEAPVYKAEVPKEEKMPKVAIKTQELKPEMVETPKKKIIRIELPNQDSTVSDKIDVPQTEVRKSSSLTKTASLNSKKVNIENTSIETNNKKGGWYLQISAESDKESANSKIQELTSSNLRGTIQETNVDGKTFYRVLVGPYKNKEDVSEARKSNLVRPDSFPRYIE